MATSNFNPTRCDAGLLIEPVDASLQITDTVHQRSLTLGPAETSLWAYLDGSRSVCEIAAAMSRDLGIRVEPEDIWRSLDGLADLGLLAHRLTPPAGDSRVGRRRFLRAGSALVAGSAAALAPSLASAFCAFVDPTVPSEMLDKEIQCKDGESEVLSKEQVEKFDGEMNRKQQEFSSKEVGKQQEEVQKSFDAEINNKEFYSKRGEQDAKEQATKIGELQWKDSDNPTEMFGKCRIGLCGPMPPIPEPGTVALFGTGIAVLALAAWRRKQADQPQDQPAPDVPPLPPSEKG